jgi:hypothetical protein
MFQKLEVLKRKRRRLFLTWLILLCILVTSIILIIQFLIPVPTFNFVENVRTNQPLIFESHKKFWVEVDNNKTYSKTIDDIQRINLGKIEGKKNYTFGGLIDLGLFKIESQKRQTYSLDRDYSSIDTAFEVKRYMTEQDPNKHYIVRVSGRDTFILEDNEGEIYSSDKTFNPCTPEISSNSIKIFRCPIKFTNDKANITVFIKDKIGNKLQLATNELVNIVPLAKLDCNSDALITNSILKCKSNKIATGILEGPNTSYQFKPNQEVIVNVDIKDGKNKIKINLKDEHDLNSSFEININAIKQS